MSKKTKNMRKQASDLADRLSPHVEAARDKAAPMIAEAREKAGPRIAEAREKAAPYVAEARGKAAPYLTEARGKAAPVISEARDKITTDVLPMLTAALAAVEEATEEARGEAKKRGRATAAALRGEVEAPKKRHRVRKLLVLLGLGGIAAAVAKKLSDQRATSTWQSSYSPTPASPSATTPPATPSAATPPADDEGAAGPDEAAADSHEVPHPATTPDNPLAETEAKRD